MIRTLYLIYDGDAYEIEADGMDVRSIWRYPGNRPRIPEVVNYKKCEKTLKHEIDNKVLKAYGEPPRGFDDNGAE